MPKKAIQFHAYLPMAMIEDSVQLHVQGLTKAKVDSQQCRLNPD